MGIMTLYSYTNEYIDSYIKLIYLRSRMYDPASGRFTTKDSWQGDYNRPLSLNRWMYVAGNPVNYIDPSGLCGLPGEPPCPPENGAVSVPDWWKNENKRQLYVEGLGYFDSEHIERGWREAAWFVKEIEAALSRNQGGMSPLARATSGDYYWVDYAVSAKIEKNDQK